MAHSLSRRFANAVEVSALLFFIVGAVGIYLFLKEGPRQWPEVVFMLAVPAGASLLFMVASFLLPTLVMDGLHGFVAGLVVPIVFCILLVCVTLLAMADQRPIETVGVFQPLSFWLKISTLAASAAVLSVVLLIAAAIRSIRARRSENASNR